MSLFGSQLLVSSVSLRNIDDGSKIKAFRVRNSFDLNRSCVYPPKSDIATEGGLTDSSDLFILLTVTLDNRDILELKEPSFHLNRWNNNER